MWYGTAEIYMSKTHFNGIYLDLSDVSLIGKLERKQGIWFAPIVWRATGMTINLNMATSKDPHAIFIGDEQMNEEKEAKDNYDRLVHDWKGLP